MTSPSLIQVSLELTADTPGSMNFRDTYEGLVAIWYSFQADKDGNVALWANAEGYEHLARYFLKLARSPKAAGYHSHHALEFGGDSIADGRELTIGICDAPEGAT